jgi:hypothetical protein
MFFFFLIYAKKDFVFAEGFVLVFPAIEGCVFFCNGFIVVEFERLFVEFFLIVVFFTVFSLTK